MKVVRSVQKVTIAVQTIKENPPSMFVSRLVGRGKKGRMADFAVHIMNQKLLESKLLKFISSFY